jgi:hypothetical protein
MDTLRSMKAQLAGWRSLRAPANPKARAKYDGQVLGLVPGKNTLAVQAGGEFLGLTSSPIKNPLSRHRGNGEAMGRKQAKAP